MEGAGAPVAVGSPFGTGCELRAAGALACVSSKCWSKSCNEANVSPQHVKSFIKAASILGRYEEEWKDGDWPIFMGAGEVPAIMMLLHTTVSTGVFCRRKEMGGGGWKKGRWDAEMV